MEKSRYLRLFITKKPQAQNKDSAGQADSTESNSEGQSQSECSQEPSHVAQNLQSAHGPPGENTFMNKSIQNVVICMPHIT